MLTDAHHHHHYHQQQQPHEQLEPPRMRRFKRVGGNNAELSQPDSLTAGVTLAEFVRCNQLPGVVRVVGGQFAGIGCGSNDADAEIYVHSISSPTSGATSASKTTTSVFAEVMRYSNDKENDKQSPTSAAWRIPGRYGNRHIVATASPVAAKRLVTTGRTICLPINGREVAGCWFELLSEDGRAAPPIASVEDLANRALRPPGVGESKHTTRYLVRQTVFGSIGSISSTTVAIQPGDTLTPVRLVSSSPVVNYSTDNKSRNKNRHIQLQCFDDRRRSIFLPLDQKGLFSPIADSEELPEAMPPRAVGVVYDGIQSVLSLYRLPVTVRVVAGRLSIPDSIGASSPSMIFRLTSVSKLTNAKDDRASNSFQTDHGEQVVYVMSLRHAWSLSSTVTSSAPVLYSGGDDVDDEWQPPLIGIPASAATRLKVVAASRDFYVSWLSTDDGREVSSRCDRIIARHRTDNHDDVSRTRKNSSTRGNDRDAVSWNSPRRQTSLDSGLASSALNDDLYDEIDHIYCMIRYGPAAGSRSIFSEKPAPPSTLRQRAQSYDDSTPKVGCRIEPSGGGYIPRGVAAVLNERTLLNDVKRRINEYDEVGARQNRTDTAAAVDKFCTPTNGNIRQQQQQREQRPDSRSSSRIAVEIVKSLKPEDVNQSDYGGRSEHGVASRKSSLIAYGDGKMVMESESAIVNSDEFWSDNEGDSGNVITVDLTTISGESNPLQVRKYARRQSAHDLARVTSPPIVAKAAERETPTKNRGRRAHSATGQRTKRASDDLVEGYSRNDVVESSPQSPTDVMDSSESRQIRKSPAFVATLSQSLVNALRRVVRRTVPRGVDEEPETPPAIATRQKKRNANTKNKNKSDANERKSTTWYDDVVITPASADNNNNNDLDEDAEVFDFGIGDGRPNDDVRRDWYGTSRSRHSWVATSHPDVDEPRSSRRLFQKSRDPPLLIGASGGVYLVGAGGQTTKRNKTPADLFGRHRGMRTAADKGGGPGIYTHGQYTDLGLY